jgi:DNA-binding NtrC family response regulator
VGELPLALQAQLLRVVQERTYKLVGSNTWRRTRFRLVCATHRELASEVPQGRFRKDLYHRLAAQVFHLPPLRERPEDILPLARHFLRALRPEAPPELDAAVATYLQGREYPGNVRELRQLMGRLFRRHVGHGPITVGDIPADERPAAQEPERWRDAAFARAVRRALDCGVGLKELSRLTAETAVDLALADEGGNLQRAARRLGVTDRALQLRRARWKA